MAILVLRHEPFEHLGHFAHNLKHAGIPFEYKDLGQSLTLDGHAGLVIMGGPQSANEDDPVLGSFASPTTFFHWHGETFDLPADSELLAYSDVCRHQAFRYKRNVYAVQFHPEIQPEMIVDWSAQPANCGDVENLAAPVDPHAFDSAALAKTVLDGWL